MAIVAPQTWYTYTYSYPNGTVFYVGKGTGARIDSHEQEARRGCKCDKCCTIRLIWEHEKSVLKRVEMETLHEREALSNEQALINKHRSRYLTNVVRNLRLVLLPQGHELTVLLQSISEVPVIVTTKPTFKDLRVRAGYKIARLARDSGVSPSSIYRIEDGDKVTPELVQLALTAINNRLHASYTASDLTGLNFGEEKQEQQPERQE